MLCFANWATKGLLCNCEVFWLVYYYENEPTFLKITDLNFGQKYQQIFDKPY